MIGKLRAFGAFWYDFIVGDDWLVALGVLLALAITYAAQPHHGRSGVVDRRRGRRNSVAPQRLPGDTPSTLSRLATFILLGIHAGRVTLQRLLAGVERLEGGRTVRCAEHVAGGNLGIPVLQLHQLDFVLLEFAEGEMVCIVFFFQSGVKVAALVEDLVILVVPGGLEQCHHVLLAGQCRAGQQDGRAVHLQNFAAQSAQGTFGAVGGGQRRRRILQVDRAQRFQPPPHGRAQPGRIRRDPIHQQQPAGRIGVRVCGPRRFLSAAASITHSVSLPDIASAQPLTSAAVRARCPAQRPDSTTRMHNGVGAGCKPDLWIGASPPI